jgi:hypothetical protein
MPGKKKTLHQPHSPAQSTKISIQAGMEAVSDFRSAVISMAGNIDGRRLYEMFKHGIKAAPKAVGPHWSTTERAAPAEEKVCRVFLISSFCIVIVVGGGSNFPILC